MIDTLWETRFTTDLTEAAAKAAFEAFNEKVRQGVPPDRLLEWRPEEGWGPICTALGVPVPDVPFPHANTTEDFLRENRVNSVSPPSV